MNWGDGGGTTIWAPFAADTDYFGSANQWMVNYRVDDLDGLLGKLRDEGVRVDEEAMEDENGKFGWCWDSEGNKIELWEPPPGR
jgi:predicted enzyme related to lactoylglutathione lyase